MRTYDAKVDTVGTNDGSGMAIVRSELYAERSLVMYKLRFNKRGTRDDVLDPHKLLGKSATELFEDYCSSRWSDVVRVDKSDRFVTVKGCVEYDGGALASYSSGRAGESGIIVNTETANVEHQYSGISAPMPASRLYMRLLPGAMYAIACVEHVNGAAGDTALLNDFRKYLSEAEHGVVLSREQVLIAEAMEAFTSVENVEFRTYVARPDIADNVGGAVGEDDYMSIKLSHRRRHPFPLSFLANLLRDKGSVRTMFGGVGKFIDPDDPGSSIYVTVKDRMGSTRRFTLGESMDIPLREVLNPINTPPLGDDEFVRRCNEKCEYAFEMMGRNA